MVFKRLLGSLGVGGPAVDTVLDPGAVLPGGTLSGEVRLAGGSAAVDVDHITLALVARVEAEQEDGESEGSVVLERFTVGGGFRLAEDEQRVVRFDVPLPWETPVTELYGQPLGAVLGVRTELAVTGARDKGDLNPLAVRPLPVQEAVLEALGQLGFGFRSADLEYGRIGGTGQQLPFYQQIELTPAPQYVYGAGEFELTFVAHTGGMEVVVEADKRGGFLGGGHDTLGRFTVSHDAAGVDWNALVDGWFRQLLGSRSTAVYAEPHHDSRPGMGTAVAAGTAGLAVGVVGGMVAAEVVDEVGDFFEGDEEVD